MSHDTLIAKLEAATEGSRELDEEIHAELRPYVPLYPAGDPRGARDYTTSFDAALWLAKTAAEYSQMLGAAFYAASCRASQNPMSDAVKFCAVRAALITLLEMKSSPVAAASTAS